MGLSFDGNGKYVGWSSIFDHSTLETIQASEYLPYPKKMLYNNTTKGYNLKDYKTLKANLENNIKRWNKELQSPELDTSRI